MFVFSMVFISVIFSKNQYLDLIKFITMVWMINCTVLAWIELLLQAIWISIELNITNMVWLGILYYNHIVM